MRPVIKGDCPREEDGSERTYTSYVNARGDLISRIGEYCSYCEMELDASLAVEHVLPKVPKGQKAVDEIRALSWDNFLLACPNCNSTKKQKEPEDDAVFWPDKANTFYYLSYREGGIVTFNPKISAESKKRIEATIELVGLDKTPEDGGAESDRRWKNRREAWDIAAMAKHDLATDDTPLLRKWIVKNAVSKGYWSVWMTIFHDDADMRSRLIQAFVGTGADCFDPDHSFCAVEFVR